MKRRWAVLVVALVVVIGGGTWFLLRDDGWSDDKFESCEVVGQQLVLRYSYGLGDDVRTTAVTEAGKLTVRLELRADGDPHDAVALNGEMRVNNRAGYTSVTQHDGSRLDCGVPL